MTAITLRTRSPLGLAIFATGFATAPAGAAFIVEAHSSGLANANFTVTGGSATASLASRAAGTTASNSVFGSTNSELHEYVATYTPGVDADNYSPDPETDLGNGQTATAEVGGPTGVYNVYATWPPTANVIPHTTATVGSACGDLVVEMIDQNSGGTGEPGGNGAWFLLGSVVLREGETSTVSFRSENTRFVSQRLHGILWERQPAENPNLLDLSCPPVFGLLEAGAGPQTRGVAIMNNGGDLALALDSATVTGPDAGLYTVDAFPATLADGAEGEVTVTFDPGVRFGRFNATLELASNDPGDPVVSVDLSAEVPDPSRLVAHYKMDEAEGDVLLDASGNGFDGRYLTAGGGAFTLGVPGLAGGSAVEFLDAGGGDPDAGAGFAEVSADVGLPPLDTFSVAFWVRVDAADIGSVSGLVSKGDTIASDPFALFTNTVDPVANGALWSVGEDPGVFQLEPPGVLQVGQVHHVTVTHLDENRADAGATRTRLYIDGDLVAENADPNGFDDTAAPTPFQIGAITGRFGLTGVIDDVQVYARELGASNVAFLFANPGETAPAGGDPTDDSDGDGLPDAYEEEHFGGLGQGAADDFDGDGADNRAEFIAGTDPADARSVFAAAVGRGDAAGAVRLNWPSTPGLSYAVEFKDDPAAPAWTNLAFLPAAAAPATATQFDDDGALDRPRRIYRVRVEPGGEG